MNVNFKISLILIHWYIWHVLHIIGLGITILFLGSASHTAAISSKSSDLKRWSTLVFCWTYRKKWSVDMFIISTLMMVLGIMTQIFIDTGIYLDGFVIVLVLLIVIDICFIAAFCNWTLIRTSISSWLKQYDNDIDRRGLILMTRRVFVFNIFLIVFALLFLAFLNFMGLYYLVRVFQCIAIINGLLVGPINYVLQRKEASHD